GATRTLNFARDLVRLNGRRQEDRRSDLTEPAPGIFQIVRCEQHPVRVLEFKQILYDRRRFFVIGRVWVPKHRLEHVVPADLDVFRTHSGPPTSEENVFAARFHEVVHDLQRVSGQVAIAPSDRRGVGATPGLGGASEAVEIGVNHGYVGRILDAEPMREFYSIRAVNPVSVENEMIGAVGEKQAGNFPAFQGNPFDANETIMIAQLYASLRLDHNGGHQL